MCVGNHRIVGDSRVCCGECCRINLVIYIKRRQNDNRNFRSGEFS